MNGSVKAWTILSLIALVLILSFHYWGGRQGLLWGVVIALTINGIIYFHPEIRLEKLFSGQIIEGQNPWHLLEVTRNLAQKARVPIPRVVILPYSAPQAIVMGRRWNSSTIYLTEGLLHCLTAEEKEAVIAYQISCIKKLDTLLFSISSATIGALFGITQIFDLFIRGILGSKLDSRSRQNHLFSWLVTPLANYIVKITIGPQRYLDNDSLAASWIRNPKFLAHALWKMESYAATNPLTIPAFTAPLFIVNPLREHGWSKYFHAHPRIEQRIKNLVGYYPI